MIVVQIILTVLLVIVLVIAALIVLLTLDPLRFTFEYKEPGLLIQLRAGPLRFTLMRRETPEQRAERERKKAEKAAKKKKKKKKKPVDPEEKKRRRKEIPALIRKVLEELTRKGKIKLDKLWLDVTFGGEDPASAAMLFGGAHAVLGILWPVVEHYCTVKDRRIRTEIDFNLPKTRVDYFCAVYPLPVAKGLAIGLRILIWQIRERKKSKQPEKQTKQQTPEEQKEAV